MLSSKLEGTAGEGGAPTAGWTEVRWRVRAPSAGEGQVVCVVGSSEVLGAWNHDAALELAREEGKPDAWWGRARLARGVECRYKYFIREGAAIAKWESWRENRRLVPLGVELFVDDGRFGVEKTSPSSSPSPSSPSPPSSSSSSSDVWEDHGWLVSDIQVRAPPPKYLPVGYFSSHPPMAQCRSFHHLHRAAPYHAGGQELGAPLQAAHASCGAA